MRPFKLGLALLAALGIVALVLKLATAPLYAVYDSHDCRQAYARAKSLADTIRVDLHLYDAADPHARHTCGEIRARVLSSAVDVSTLQADKK